MKNEHGFEPIKCINKTVNISLVEHGRLILNYA